MRDLDRFTAFLQREGARYNAPPETPVEGMWLGMEEGLGGNAVASAGATGGVGEAGAPAGVGSAEAVPFDALGYHEPPPVPRAEMWERVEAEVRSRGLVVALGDGVRSRAAGRRALSRWTTHVGGPGWAVGLAAAASLVLGLALGRNTVDSTPAAVSVEPDGPAQVSRTAPTAVEGAADPAPAETTTPSAPALELVADPGPLAVERSNGAPGAVTTESVTRVAESAPAEQPIALPNPFEVEEDYATVAHLGRAATLLTAFRIDQGTPGSEQDLAVWARKLLGDTRMFLDMPVPRSSAERALLEDLELVLIQIARLGPGAPDFERQLARESMEGQGTLMRLRAASTAGET